MKKFLALALFFVTITASQHATGQNAGFELNNLSGWSTNGGMSTSGTSSNNLGGKEWVVNPYGSYMGKLSPTSSITFDSALLSLGLTAAENQGVRSFLSANSGGGSPTPTNAAWAKTSVTLQAGTTYSFAWNYLSTDYYPFNDGSMMTLTNSDGSIVPTLNNSNQRYALLGFTNPGSGNYSTGSYGSTGWQVATFMVSVTGVYDLGFAAFNLGDTVLSPILYIDEIQGTTTLNGQSYGPVAPNAGSSAPTTPTAPTLCCGGSSTAFTANTTNTAKVQVFMSRTTADTKVLVEQIGNQNTIVVNQEGSNNNYVKYYGSGSNNNINVKQMANNSLQTNYVDLTVTGNSNTVDIQQQTSNETGSFSKGVFANVADNNNTLTVQQKNSGNHYAEVSLSGGNKNVDILQQGSGNHMAKIGLTGLPTDLSLSQSGSTQQYYSINFNCATVGGCAKITVTQGQ